MKMKHDQVGNPYHISSSMQFRKGAQGEKTLDDVYSLLEQVLLELKAIHEHQECMEESEE